MTTVEELTTQLQDYIVHNEQKVKISFDRVEEEMSAVQRRVAQLEEIIKNGSHGGEGDSGGKGRSLIHAKMITPTVLLNPNIGRNGREIWRSIAIISTLA